MTPSGSSDSSTLRTRLDSIAIVGGRQTGRTERMIWIAVGGILAGAHPKISSRTMPDCQETRRRLRAALEQVGYDGREAHRLAEQAVITPTQESRGASYRLYEVEG